MDYKDYDAFDFLNDEFFVLWVNRPTAEAQQFWGNWIEQHPKKRKDIELAKNIVLSSKFTQLRLSDGEKDKVLAGLLSKLDRNRTSIPFDTHSTKRKKISFTWQKIAATLALIIASVFIFYQYQTKVIKPIRPQQLEIKTIVKSNPAGIKSKIKLPDGTIVFLNSNSEITFPESFKTNRREINLKGEAYFIVTEDKDAPFLVTSNYLVTEALGTSFNIRAEQNNNKVQISLVEGKVKVSHKLFDREIILYPNEQVTPRNVQDAFTKLSFDKDDILAWTVNTIVFKDASFEEVISKLSEWYGVEFIVQRKPQSFESYNASFKDKSLEIILENLQFTSDIMFEIKKERVFIK